MLRQWFCWFVLTCFIIHVACNIHPQHEEPLSSVSSHAAVPGLPKKNPGAQPFFAVELLEEHHTFFDDLSRSERSKSRSSSCRNQRKLQSTQGWQQFLELLVLREPTAPATHIFYKPLNFVLSEYHGFIFRLTPF